VSAAIYIESKIDGKSYCKTNGQFTRHLRSNNLTYQDYYEKFVTGSSPRCKCGNRLTFYQKTETYANSCGNPKCVGNTISIVKSNWTKEQRYQDKSNKKKAAAARSKEQIKEQVARARDTFKEKYGVEWISNLESQKERSRQTKLEKYGNARYNNSKTASISRVNRTLKEKQLSKIKRYQTNLKKYGVENPLLRPESLSKSAKHNSVGRDFTLPSGKVIGVRGYEDSALLELIENYNYNELDIIFDDMKLKKSPVPVFKYIDNRRHHLNYYPDIYIPKENRIIEVKSQWWWDGHGAEKYRSRLENNLRKRQAVLDKGYNYEVWIFENKYSYKVLKDDKDF
jgi:ATPase subunit of ABC transporter with duplicated ATPase domains